MRSSSLPLSVRRACVLSLSFAVLSGAPVQADDAELPAVETRDLGIARKTIEEAAAFLRAGGIESGGPRPFEYLLPSPQRQKIEAALDVPSDVEFIDTELQQAIQFLADRHQIPIIPDVPLMKDRDDVLRMPLNLVISGVPLRHMLDMMLPQLELDYVIERDALFITRRARAAQTLETRLYDVRRFPAEYTSERLADVIRNTVAAESWRPAACEADRVASGPTEVDAPPFPGQRPQAPRGPAAAPPPELPFLELPLGTIEAVPGAVVVRQTQRVHREIAELLRQFDLFLQNAGPQDQAAATSPPPEFSVAAAARQIDKLCSINSLLIEELERRVESSAAERLAAHRQAELLRREIVRWQEEYRAALTILEREKNRSRTDE